MQQDTTTTITQPKKLGRRPKAEEAKQNKALIVFLTQEEYMYVVDKAVQEGRSNSSFARKLILDTISN